MSSCSVINFTAISCITPELTRLRPGDGSGLSYTIRIDNAQGPDPNAESLQIQVTQNPSNFNLVNSEYNPGTNAPIRIMVSVHLMLRKLFYNKGKQSCISQFVLVDVSSLNLMAVYLLMYRETTLAQLVMMLTM